MQAIEYLDDNDVTHHGVKKVQVDEIGYRTLVSVDYARANLPTITPLLDRWDICLLKNGWKIDGHGYGNNIMKVASDETIGHAIIFV
jgi:hypothetical protein